MTTGAFDLLDRPLLFIPVKWPGLAQAADGGAVAAEHEVDIQIELLDRDEFSEWIVAANLDIEGGDSETIRFKRATHELATFKRVAKGWRRMKVGRRDAEFNDENIALLLRWPGFVTAFGQHYMDAWRGELATREGNFDGSPANGQAGEPIDETPKAATRAS